MGFFQRKGNVLIFEGEMGGREAAGSSSPSE